MPDAAFDQEFVRVMMKYSDEMYLRCGFHMHVAGWIAWIKHVMEMSGKRVSNFDALKRLERRLDHRPTNPFHAGVRMLWENQVIELHLDRRTGPRIKQKVEEACQRLKDLLRGNGATVTPDDWNSLHSLFRVRILEMVAIQMALGEGQHHVGDAAARAFRKMWTANEGDIQEHLPSPLRAWPPVFELEET